MKTSVLILFFSFSASIAVVDAQYKINKTKYNYHYYQYMPGDPYNPATAGIASLVVPGLGQMISGEPLRGLAAMGRCTLFLGCSFGGLLIVGSSDERDPDFFRKQNLGSMMWLGGAAGALINWILGIPDAVKVAKVNNLAYRDHRKKQGTMSLVPCLVLPISPENGQIAAGITLNITF